MIVAVKWIIHHLEVLQILFIVQIIFIFHLLSFPTIPKSEEPFFMFLPVFMNTQVVSFIFDLIKHVSFQNLSLEPDIATLKDLISIACIESLLALVDACCSLSVRSDAGVRRQSCFYIHLAIIVIWLGAEINSPALVPHFFNLFNINNGQSSRLIHYWMLICITSNNRSRFH